MDDWDWELLHDSQNPEAETEAKVEELHNSASSASSLCDDSGVIRSDYFSLESHHKFAEQEEEEEESSDNPSWVDPSNISVAGRRERISSCSNSDSSDPSDSRNLHLLIDPHSDCAIDYSDNKWSDSGGNDNGIETLISGDFHGAIDSHNKGVSVENLTFNSQEEEQHEHDESEVDQQLLSHLNANTVSEVEESGSGLFSESNENKRAVWWKVPLEVLKYCVLRVSPVWSLSMAAAAVMGFVILRRRYLYKMKRKTQGLQLKVTVDDKKVSQFMSRAARLNEAFSVVKRVPIIRPSLPAPGLAPWPMVSLR
ncbi:ATG8-interacting protein 2 [Bienertia sinuspersici]